jgi:hypothetical protein
MSAVAEIQAICGQTAAAGRIAGDFDLLSANSPISKFAYEANDAELIWLAHEPRLDRIRGDRRFALLVGKVMPKSSEGWRSES